MITTEEIEAKRLENLDDLNALTPEGDVVLLRGKRVAYFGNAYHPVSGKVYIFLGRHPYSSNKVNEITVNEMNLNLTEEGGLELKNQFWFKERDGHPKYLTLLNRLGIGD